MRHRKNARVASRSFSASSVNTSGWHIIIEHTDNIGDIGQEELIEDYGGVKGRVKSSNKFFKRETRSFLEYDNVVACDLIKVQHTKTTAYGYEDVESVATYILQVNSGNPYSPDPGETPVALVRSLLLEIEDEDSPYFRSVMVVHGKTKSKMTPKEFLKRYKPSRGPTVTRWN
jgi:hypothetical protein